MFSTTNSLQVHGMTFQLKNLPEETDILREAMDLFGKTFTGSILLEELVQKITCVTICPLEDLNFAFGVSMVKLAEAFYPNELQIYPVLKQKLAFSDEENGIIYLNRDLIRKRADKGIALLESLSFELGNLLQSGQATELQSNPCKYRKEKYIERMEKLEGQSLIISRDVLIEICYFKMTEKQKELFPSEMIRKRLSQLPKPDEWIAWNEKENEYGFIHADIHRTWWERKQHEAQRQCIIQ